MTLNYLSTAEAEKWIDGLASFDRDNEIIALCICAAFGKPASCLDVGSGDGALVNTFEKLGVEINGLDQLPRPNHPKLLQRDLREPIDLGRKYELVTCVEVAEHLPPEYADVLVETITRHAERRIVFTAAMPGQLGHNHFNCQPATYWREKFFRRGWTYNDKDAYRLAAILALAEQSSHHVDANLQVFRWPIGK